VDEIATAIVIVAAIFGYSWYAAADRIADAIEYAALKYSEKGTADEYTLA
jgi:hypothetical protein